MIRSMTGFAAMSREENGEKVNLTVKSVNHRFLDVQIKMPSSLGALESRIKALIQQQLTRGRIEVSLFLERTAPAPKDVVIDEALVERVVQAIEAVKARGLVSGQLVASDLLRIPQAIDVRARTDAASAGVSEQLSALVESVLQEALDALVVMRTTAGALRPEAGFPAPGNEPRDQHHRVKGRRRHGHGNRGGRQGGTRAAARAGPECRIVRHAACCSWCPLRPARARRPWSIA